MESTQLSEAIHTKHATRSEQIPRQRRGSVVGRVSLMLAAMAAMHVKAGATAAGVRKHARVRVGLLEFELALDPGTTRIGERRQRLAGTG